MKNSNSFLYIIIIYFIISAGFHFIRLALDWKIIIVGSQNDYSISTLVSALCVLFSVFAVFWTYKLKKGNGKKVKININEE